MRITLAGMATLWALLGGVLLIAITVVTSVNIGAFMADRVARGFGLTVAGLPGYEDFVRLSISAAALMFFPYCQLRRGHVAVDLFVNALPLPLRDALERAWLALTGLAAAFLGYWMILGLIETRADQASSPILGWPEWPFYVPGLISLALWAAIAAAQCAGSAGGPVGRPERPSESG